MPSCDACSSDCRIFVKPKEHEKALILSIGTLEAKQERLEKEIEQLKKHKQAILDEIEKATRSLKDALK